MKKAFINITAMALILGICGTAKAQNWSLTGNALSGAPSPKLGTTDAVPLSFYTQDQLRMTLTQQGKLGLGTLLPNAKMEISYCLPPSSANGGLIISKELCSDAIPQVFTFNPNLSFELVGGPLFPEGPIETQQIKVPFSYRTGHTTNVANPLAKNEGPLLWARTVGNNGWISSAPDHYDTKFIVMGDGSCGINIAQPRAALDVRGSQAVNRPAAIFGSLALGTFSNDPPLPTYYTQQVQFVPRLGADGFNRISQTGDQGMFFSDGKGAEGANAASAFIIAPWAQELDATNVGGMRMDKNGNTEFHGTVRATKVNVDAKWWSDFVFADDYKLPSLAEVEAYIAANKHLPNVPSEAEVLANGLDIANMQAIQQQKIEELTLYIIQLKKEMEAMHLELKQLKQ